MKYIRKSADRGRVDMGWLKSNHSFSFGDYFDNRHMGVSVLRVINDDIVAPGAGFGAHGHRDMEIISYVVKGKVQHRDNKGNNAIIPAGDVQIMSAGSGIIHSEFNPSNDEEVNFLQIWIHPKETGIQPRYEQKTIVQQGQMTALVTPTGENGSLTINQDASLSRLMLQEGESFDLETFDRKGYLHIVKGEIEADGQQFVSGDAFALDPDELVTIKASAELEALWFDLPA